MSVSGAAKTWLEINRAHLTHNIGSLQGRLQEGTTFCAVVKANAYGHGLKEITCLSLAEHVTHFAVDSIDEAIQVRQLAPQATIFVLGYTSPERLRDVAVHQIIQVLYDTETVQRLADEARLQKVRLPVSIKIETGTQRQGILPERLPQLLIELKRFEEFLDLTSVASHFCDAENVDHPDFSQEQLERFHQALDVVQGRGFLPRYQHIACSAPGIYLPESHGTLVRFGLALYGLWSSKSLQDKMRVKDPSFDLKPILSWKTRVAQVKDVSSNTTIGYGRTYTTDRPIRLAVLPIGYYDGYRRSFSRKSEVLIHGQRCKILGTICMNMCMVDVSTLPNVKAGDVATLLGRDGMHHITAEELAEHGDTINYEIPTMINPILPRVII